MLERLVGFPRVRMLAIDDDRFGVHIATKLEPSLEQCLACQMTARVKDRDRVAVTDLDADAVLFEQRATDLASSVMNTSSVWISDSTSSACQRRQACATRFCARRWHESRERRAISSPSAARGQELASYLVVGVDE
jgi:hypothetical protein